MQIKSLILDMDGVLWRGAQPLGNLPAIFEQINLKSFGVVLATNNATLSVSQYLEKLSSLGVNLEDWQIVNSSQAAANYLLKLFPNGGPVFVVGEPGLKDELSSYNFHHAENDVIAVVVGLDRNVNYAKFKQAATLIHQGARFIGTNPDATFPEADGFSPGAGALLSFIETSTGVKPTIVGKPFPQMYQLALERLGTKPEETIVVGDRLETDIVGAQILGCHTALVLSGVTNEESAQKWLPRPEIIGKDLTSILMTL